MDKKDKRILGELIKNSRIPITRLAKNVQLSREVVNYRIKKLKKDIIQQFYAVIDIEKLSYKRYGCFIQLKSVNEKQEKEFFNKLIKNKSITYLSPIIGKWNVAFDILAKDKQELQKIIKQIKHDYEDKIGTLILHGNMINSHMFPSKFCGIREELKFKDSNKYYKIDKLDKKIINLLSKNSRIEHQELSKKLKLTANAIKYRIKNLEKAGIILGYTISLNFKKLNLEIYNLQIKLNKEDNKLNSFLKNHLKIVYYYQYLGKENWDLDIGIICKNSRELRKFILKLRNNFPEINIYDIYIITEELKPNIFEFK